MTQFDLPDLPLTEDTNLGELAELIDAKKITEVRARRVKDSWEATTQVRGVWWFGFTLHEAVGLAIEKAPETGSAAL